MICPQCNTKLKTFKFAGYYDSFYGYKCNCQVLPQEPDSEIVIGAFGPGWGISNEWLDEEMA